MPTAPKPITRARLQSVWRPAIFAVVGAGWLRFGFANPGMVFFLGAAVVALLVWLDFERSRREHHANEQDDAVETTAPDVRPRDPPFM